MKKLITLILGVTCMASISLAQIPTTGLAAYYPFSGNANDISGNGNNGTVTEASLTTDRFGNANSAYSFNGTTDYITVPNSSTLQITGAITISAWIKTSGTADYAAILCKSTASAPRTGYLMYLDDYQKAATLLLNNSDADLQRHMAVRTVGGVSDDQWHHILTVYDQSKIKTYIDGIFQEEADYALGMVSNNMPLLIGKDQIINRYFTGDIDDIRIYNRALNATEQESLYHEGNVYLSTTLSAYYPFNGNTKDESGNGNHGVVMNAKLTTDRFNNPNSAYSFDGTDDYIAVAHSSSLNITGDITLCAWIKTNTSVNHVGIIAKTDISDPRSGYLMYLDADKLGSTLLMNSSLGKNGAVKSKTALNDGKWHHIVTTYTNNVMSMFVDGVLNNQIDYTFGINSNSQILTIGRDPYSSSRDFTGSIDDISIYSRALNNNEVQTLYLTKKIVGTDIPTEKTEECVIYPNPAYNEINVNLPTGDEQSTVSIYNTSGKLMLIKKIVENENPINISALQQGVYILKVANQNGSKTYKFIKK